MRLKSSLPKFAAILFFAVLAPSPGFSEASLFTDAEALMKSGQAAEQYYAAYKANPRDKDGTVIG